MENRHRQKGWREEETLEAAARRLLAEWDERIARKKAAERLEASAQIDNPRERVPADREKGADDEKSALGSGTLDPRRQQSTDSREVVAGGLEMGGRAGFTVGDYVFEKN